MATGRSIEQARLAEDGPAWRRWGPYLSERAWGTVREDYSEGGDAWGYLPHDHARSRAYRWNEDGLAGICDDQQRLCFALAFWNGADPILKERIFGLAGPQGNHGEDAKEHWWYLDATPTHSWMRWRYLYPQAEFPYERLVAENAARGRLDPEFELVDTGVFDDDRYWDITADYAKAGPDDLCIRLRVRNAGPDAATLHVLPTLWFRNTWSWGLDDRQPGRSSTRTARSSPSTTASAGWCCAAAGRARDRLFCENESNAARLWGVERHAATRRTASTTTSSTGRRPSTPTGRARRRRSGTALDGARRARRPRSGCASPPTAAGRRGRSSRCWPTASARPTSSTRH